MYYKDNPTVPKKTPNSPSDFIPEYFSPKSKPKPTNPRPKCRDACYPELSASADRYIEAINKDMLETINSVWKQLEQAVASGHEPSVAHWQGKVEGLQSFLKETAEDKRELENDYLVKLRCFKMEDEREREKEKKRARMEAARKWTAKTIEGMDKPMNESVGKISDTYTDIDVEMAGNWMGERMQEDDEDDEAEREYKRQKME